MRKEASSSGKKSPSTRDVPPFNLAKWPPAVLQKCRFSPGRPFREMFHFRGATFIFGQGARCELLQMRRGGLTVLPFDSTVDLVAWEWSHLPERQKQILFCPPEMQTCTNLLRDDEED